MSTTDILAICGLITGTISLLWNFIQWKLSRPRLRFELTPLSLDLDSDQCTLLREIFSIINVGELPTTLYKCICEYKLKSGEIVSGMIVPDLPKILGPGETHDFAVSVRSKTPGDTVTITAKIYHAHSRMPLKKSVKFQLLDSNMPGAEKYRGKKGNDRHPL